jgi:hypothetical protein
MEQIDNSNNNFKDLNNKLIYNILKFLDRTSMFKLCLTNKHYYLSINIKESTPWNNENNKILYGKYLSMQNISNRLIHFDINKKELFSKKSVKNLYISSILEHKR